YPRDSPRDPGHSAPPSNTIASKARCPHNSLDIAELAQLGAQSGIARQRAGCLRCAAGPAVETPEKRGGLRGSRGDVVVLPGVAIEVVELEAVLVRRTNELPPRRAQCDRPASVSVLAEPRYHLRHDVSPGTRGEKIAARQGGRDRRAKDGRDRRQDVDSLRHVRTASLRDARSYHHERHADRRLVEILAVRQLAMLEEFLAVVRHYHDNRVVEHTPRLEFPEKRGELIVPAAYVARVEPAQVVEFDGGRRLGTPLVDCAREVED